MALKRNTNKAELPEGAVLVSETEALIYQKNLVQNWPLESEVLCLKFGSLISGAVTAVSSAIITNHFRLFFKSDFKIIALTLIPGFGMPFYLTKSFTETIVTNDILLMKVQCPMCTYAKFALQQFYTSFLFPSLFAFSAYAMYSDLKGTSVIPNIQKDPKQFWKESFRAFKSGGKSFQVVGLLQTALVLFLPYWQNRELHNITNKSEEEKDSELLLN